MGGGADAAKKVNGTGDGGRECTRRRAVAVAALLALLLPRVSRVNAQATRTITYAEALQLAVQHNVDLRQAQLAAASDEVAVAQARRNLLPDLRFSTQGTQNYGRNFNQNDGQIVNQSTQSMNAGLSSSLTVFDGLRNRSNIRQAQSSLDASEQGATRARQTALYTVASTSVALVAQGDQLAVREQALAAQKELEAQILAYVDAGSRSIADLYAQQAAVANANLELVQARRSVELARLDLMRTLQLDAAGSYEFPPPPVPADAATPPLDSLIATALAHRPDLAAQGDRLKAAESSASAASAARLPTVSLSLGYNTSFSRVSSFSFADQLDQRRGGDIAVGISLPLFDRGSASSNTQLAAIQVDKARLLLERQRQDVGLDVRRAWLDLASAREALVAAEAQRRSADMALTASRERYQAGAATLVELTQARATQIQAATAYVAARYTVVLQQTVMRYATGGSEVGTGDGGRETGDGGAGALCAPANARTKPPACSSLDLANRRPHTAPPGAVCTPVPRPPSPVRSPNFPLTLPQRTLQASVHAGPPAMALVQRDFILRMIEAIAAAIARIRKRRSEGDLVGARQDVRQATMELLGPAAAMAIMVDVRTAANLISDPHRLRLWCHLLAEDSALLSEMGKGRETGAVDRRIVELLLEAWQREKEWDEHTEEVFAAARARGGAEHIDAAFRAALAAWDADHR